MRLLFPSTQTRPYYDRNAFHTALIFADSPILPHSMIERSSYTCPANRRACITSVSLFFMRMTAPTTPGTVFLGADLLTYSGTGFIASLGTEKIAIYDTAALNFPTQIWMTEGMKVTLKTQDYSIGGSALYRMFVTLVEFDK